MAYIYPTGVHNVSDSFQDHLNRGSVNPGTDYTSAYGDTVVAVAAGTVTDASNDNGGGGGRTVHIDHDDGTGSDYLHLSQVQVNAGQWIAQGTRVGLSGASGNGSDWYYGAHLHLSFRPNHSHGYSNNGNQDFDALMAKQTAPPITPVQAKEDEEMRIVTVPNGTVALVGEYTGLKYTSASGSQGFSYQANMVAYGTSSGLTEDQVSTLVSEASTRRNALITDVTNRVNASQQSQTPGSAFWALIVGAILLVLALVAIPILVTVAPGTLTQTIGTLANFLIGAGAVLIGYAIASYRKIRPASVSAPPEGEE